MITLKTLPEATAQEVFNQVAEHLLTQQVESLNDGCAYRNPQGLKCAAGCLMADDEYSPAMEGRTWDSLTRTEDIPCAHRALIVELQGCHDFYDPSTWGCQLEQIAIDFGLSTQVVHALSESVEPVE